MAPERILICGGGIAGCTLAFLLARNNFEVIVVERSKAEQKAGQGLEIEEPALKVVKEMGILEKIQEKRTGELGFELCDEKSRLIAILEAGGMSPTGNLEIMRGDLTEVIYKAADEFDNATFRFETTVQSLRQTKDKVIVDLINRTTKVTKTEEFDLVVGADGVLSYTRQLIMGSPEKLNCFKQVGAYIAYFSIPKEEQDWPNSRLCNFPGRRVVWTRPIGKDSQETTVHLIHLNNHIPALRHANINRDRQAQKEAFAELYKGCGWETPRIIKQMMTAENFYSDELVQVKLPTWSQNRVVLLGDSAWAPSPFTGQGNQLALIGAWVLAQELARNRNEAAFEMYEKRLRKYVEECQKIPLGGYAQWVFIPDSRVGIWMVRLFFRVLAWAYRAFVWAGLGRFLPDEQKDDFDLEIGKDGGI